MNCFWIIKIFTDKKSLKMVKQKHKIDVMLELVFIILGLFLQMINLDRVILMTKIYQIL